MVGWAGGWGHDFNPGPGDDITSGTTDGGATWFSANDAMGRFVNRFRFFANSNPSPAMPRAGRFTSASPPIRPKAAQALAAHFNTPPQRSFPPLTGSMEIKAEVPANAQHLMVTVFNRRQKLMKVVADETTPRSGLRTFTWDFRNEEGSDSGSGLFHLSHRRRRQGQERHGGARGAGGDRGAGGFAQPGGARRLRGSPGSRCARMTT